ALEESIREDDFEHFRVVVESLTDEFDVMEVALAAVKLAHEATGAAAEEEEIPEVGPRPGRAGRAGREGGGPRGDSGGGGGRRGRVPASGMTRLFVGAGRTSGIRPQDLVGAIAGESGLSGRDIGAIEIADRFSLVEVPEASADEVIAAMRAGSIKGKRTTVRRERDEAR
ncbi:MAG TPA: DbpA RNA binding domain-containing protein, partial [Acidimicrobiales bacterium]|nr:DbpA RNA binding domain-containing protein [Acidimicrobiales bacterium]